MTTSVHVSVTTDSDVRFVEVVSEDKKNGWILKHVLRDGEKMDFTVFDEQTVSVREIAEGDIPEDAVMRPK